MQRQPTSLFLVADAYQRELLVDAARVRPVPKRQAEGRAVRRPLARCCRAVVGLLGRARRPLAAAPLLGQPRGRGLVAAPSRTALPD